MLKLRRYKWVILALLAIIVRIALPASWIEVAYSRGIFQGIRVLIDNTVGLLPFPTLYLFLVVLLTYLIFKAKKFFAWKTNWKTKLGSFAFGLLSFLSATIFLFLVLWGYNYGRIPLENQLSFEPKPLSFQELQEEFLIVTNELKQARIQIPTASDSVLEASLFPKNAEKLIRQDLEKWMSEHNFPTFGNVRGRLLKPKGVLLHISTAGVYLPWIGEGHIDAGMYEIQLPFVIAHEMSHGYGFTDEGTCNFLAYQALKNSKNLFFKYSGVLGYWYYLSSAIRRPNPEEFSRFYEELPMGIKNDLKKNREYRNRYEDIMPRFRDAAYNQYLKAQGIEEGMKNYSRVIMLATAFRKKN